MNNVTYDIGGTLSPQTGGGSKLEHVGETATYTSPAFSTADMRALLVDLTMRVVGTGSVTVSIERYDKPSDTWINVLTGVAITTNSNNRYRVTPDLAAAANVTAQEHLPELYRVVVTHNNGNATTYSLSATLTH